MNASPRSLSILADITPALEAARRADGYYPPLVVIRDMIAARHGEQAANTLYHKGLSELIQRHAAPLYSSKGAREFARAGRLQERQPLQGYNWFGACASPFKTALDHLRFRLERLIVGDVIPVRPDLLITRIEDSAFRVRYGSTSMTVRGWDYAHSVARLHVALLYGAPQIKPARRKLETAQSGTGAVV